MLWLELTMWLMLPHSGLNRKILSTIRDDVKSDFKLSSTQIHTMKRILQLRSCLCFSLTGWSCFGYVLGSSSNNTIHSFSKNSHPLHLLLLLAQQASTVLTLHFALPSSLVISVLFFPCSGKSGGFFPWFGILQSLPTPSFSRSHGGHTVSRCVQASRYFQPKSQQRIEPWSWQQAEQCDSLWKDRSTRAV